jgi:hypothetical protein
VLITTLESKVTRSPWIPPDAVGELEKPVLADLLAGRNEEETRV